MLCFSLRKGVKDYFFVRLFSKYFPKFKTKFQDLCSNNLTKFLKKWKKIKTIVIIKTIKMLKKLSLCKENIFRTADNYETITVLY